MNNSNIESMNIKDEITQLKKTISEGEIESAIERLKTLVPNLKNEVSNEKFRHIEGILLKLSSDFQHLLKKEREDVFDYDSLKIINNKLVITLISLIHEIEKYIEPDSSDNALLNGLIKIHPKKATELAIQELENSQSMKVIGIARQNFAEFSQNNYIVDFYRKIEEKMGSITKSGKPFYIKRITQHILKDKFKKHLKTCYELIENSNNQYEIVLYGNLKITYTYYIINSNEDDKSVLFLSLNTKDSNIELVDTTLVFYTRDQNIISKFNSHFDQFWNEEGQKGRVIKNLTDFKKYIPFDKQIYQKYNEIKNFIKRVPNDSVRVKHLKHEVNLFHRRMKKLDNCVMAYIHTNENQRVSDCFSDYIQDLREGNKSYKTISVKGFWETLYDVQGFLEKQEISLHKGAKIDRVYLVDSSEINSNNDNSAEQIAILRNYLQHLQYDNYRFYILFSTDEKEIIRRENYAIWENLDIKYKVLFLINYGPNPNAVTRLTFANFSNINDAKMHEHQVKLNDYEFRFGEALKRAREQNSKLLKYLKDKKDTDLNIKDEVLEERLDFLRSNGIIEIESFLKEKITEQNKVQNGHSR